MLLTPFTSFRALRGNLASLPNGCCVIVSNHFNENHLNDVGDIGDCDCDPAPKIFLKAALIPPRLNIKLHVCTCEV